MLENYKKLIKCMKVLNGFEEYRYNVGFGGRLSAFSYPRLSGSFDYKKDQLTLISDKGISYHVNSFLHNGRKRTKIASNKLKLGYNSENPRLNIQYFDDYFTVTSPALHKYDLTIPDLLVEENHFQYSLLENIPCVEDLKEAQQIFDLLLSENMGHIGELELPNFDYDGFLRWMRDQTCYVAEYWEKIDV